MARQHYNLPPLTTLAVFEAAARRLSFKDAAAELNVTPGAVSHQIRALEGDLGVNLFERRHREVVLTESGLELSLSLQRSFSDVSASLSRIRQTSINAAVTAASTTAVSSLWLTPRLTRFWREHQLIPVNQIVSDQPVPGNALVDLRIQYGRAELAGARQAEIFRDTLVPVCSPEVARSLQDASLDDLARAPLIHLDVDDERWTTWRSWFRELGYSGAIDTGLRVNNFTIALQAAKDGAGVVLGWERLCRPVIQSGDLVVPGAHRRPAPHGFYIVVPPGNIVRGNTEILRDWLLANA